MSIPNFQDTERIMNPMESDHEILTVKDMCGLLRVHYSTVYKLAKDGRFRAAFGLAPTGDSEER
jgi:Helix-turn-helix domain